MKKVLHLTGIVCILILGVFLHISISMAASESGSPANEDVEKAALGTEGSFYLGFRLVEGDTISRGAEYEDSESSLTLGLDLESHPLPHRFYIRSEYLSPHDFYGDIGYAYSDTILFRNTLIGVHHNLDHYSYDRHGTYTVKYQDRNVGDEYFVDFMKNNLYLRFKAPDFPFHIFAKHKLVTRKGTSQERFMIGYFGSMDVTSESRTIDWESNDLSLGMNSHVGPVEVEYVHNQFRFDPGSGSELNDFFSSGRPPDTYPHNVIPETESYSNTIRLNTSYTGQIVAAASLSSEESSNNYSGAESEALKGAFDFQWIPDPAMSLFFRYRHLDRDKENPEQMFLAGLSSRRPYQVRPSVSTEKNLFSFTARYRPMGRLTLNGNYEFEMRERDEIDEWYVLPESTDIHRLKFSARTRILTTLKLKGSYLYQHYEDPAYNKEPDNFNKIQLNASFMPTSWMMALLDYSLTLTERGNLLYLNGHDLVENGEREGRTDRALASMSFVLSQDTTVTASWAYNRWKTEQDLAYSMWNPAIPYATTKVPYYDRSAPYKDEAHVLSLTAHSKLRKDLTLKGGLSFTYTESEYEPNPTYLAPYTSRETTETALKLELAKKVLEDWEVGLKCKASIFDDDYSQESLDQQDGEVYVTTLILKRYF